MVRRVKKRQTAPSWLHAVGLGCAALAFSVIGWSEMLRAYPKTQNGDGQFFQEMIEAMRVSIVDFHELPLWNPYQCGGVPLWDNPQGVSAAPVLWLLLPFGTTRSIQLWYIAHSAIGFLCMWVFARRELSLSRGAALVASLAFAFAGVHNQHLTGGHLVWGPYLYFPLALFFWRRAEHDLWHAVGVGAVVAWTVHEGGTYPLPYLALILGLETATRAWHPARILPIVRAGVVVVVVGFCLGASRFLPVLDQLRSHSRQLGEEHDAMTWQTLKSVFLARDHGRGVPGQDYAWTEYGDYLGPIIMGLSLVGMVTGGVERAWMLAPLVLSFLLMLGHIGPWAPWPLLKGHVYPFKQMRVPSRFDACVTVFVTAYAGLAVDRLIALAGRLRSSPRVGRALRVVILGVALLGAADIMVAGIAFGAQFFTSTPADARVVGSPRLYIGGPALAGFIDQPTQHRGQLGCWEEWAFERGAPLWSGDVPQARAVDANATIRSVTRTQNRFTLEVSAKAATRLLLNDTYDRGWTASVGSVVRSGEQLAVDVPAGDRTLVVRYWPHGLTAGFVITGLTLAGLLGLVVVGRRPRMAG